MEELKMVSVLYVRGDSVYKKLGDQLDIDCWDKIRDARKWPGGNPCIAHPPCAQWGRLRQLAMNNIELKNLSILAVSQVRQNGGVLEHPSKSTLWKQCDLPLPGSIDEFGGYTLSVDQHWWGYPAEKKTFLYIIGVREKDLPPIPLSLDAITHCIDTNKRGAKRNLKYLSKTKRDATTYTLALWLIEVCKLINNDITAR
jgi:hypothetical protein